MRNPPLFAAFLSSSFSFFSKNKKADEERRREEGVPFFRRSTREKTGGKTKRKAKTREKTKNEKELRLRNIVRDAFFSSLDRSFSSPSSRKKDKEKGAHQPSFFSSVTKGKKENAPRMKDGIRRKGDRRKKRKKRKRGGRRGQSASGKRRKERKRQHSVKRPDFACTAFLARKEELPYRCHLSSCGLILDEAGVYAKQKKVARCRMRMTAPLRCTPEQEKEGDRAHAGGRRHLS